EVSEVGELILWSVELRADATRERAVGGAVIAAVYAVFARAQFVVDAQADLVGVAERRRRVEHGPDIRDPIRRAAELVHARLRRTDIFNGRGRVANRLKILQQVSGNRVGARLQDEIPELRCLHGGRQGACAALIEPFVRGEEERAVVNDRSAAGKVVEVLANGG